MTAYIAQSLVWSLAGFILGWVLGRLGRGVQEMEEVLMPQQARRPWRSRVSPERVIGAVILVLAAVTMVTSVVAVNRLQTAAECQSRFNDIYRRALIERSESTSEVRSKQAQLATALAAENASLADPNVKQSLRIYLDAITADETSRKANPIPDNVRCG